MRILFASSRAQLSGVGGGVTHTRSMIALLRMVDGVEVETLAIDPPLASAPRALRQARAILRASVSGKPSKSEFAFAGGAEALLAERLKNGAFDVVAFNGADLLPLRRAVPQGMKTILISHNVESAIIREQVERSRLPGMAKRLLKGDVERTKESEIAGARRADLIVAISAGDAAWYRQHAPDTPVLVIPAAFPSEPYSGPRPSVSRPINIAFLAKMSWWPNRQGANWLANEILPDLPTGRIAAHFFGPGTEAFDAVPLLEGHGFVESLDAVWSTASFTLCPIFGGSGVNIKLLESLYNGVPVLTTPYGCRGLPDLDDPALAVVEPEDWPAFLAGDAAQELAGITVRPETREALSAKANADRLRAVLRSI